ncbi:hypothetical protein [Peribacillus simplex]|uniref:hypothetical protein n=1 Tax=Peribacillus simplex TaxID=1478 RepID=UPI0024C1F6CF|nr:hypothetical protein [Peribacillus simplex]WHY58635.1 hypothetical protein QNH43_10420 [Peribacillus simplex]
MEKFKIYHFSLAIILTVVGIIGSCKNWFDNNTILLIFIGLSWSTTFFYWYLKQYFFQGTMLMFTLAYGIYGFYEYSVPPYKHTGFNAVYSTIRLFFLDYDTVFNTAANKFGNVPLPIEIARWTAFLFSFATVTKLFVKYFGTSVKGLLYRNFGGHILVFGYNYQSYILIKNLKEDRHRVIVVDQSLSEENKKELFDLGVPIIKIDSFESSEFQYKNSINKASYLILFDEDDSINLENYLSVRSITKPKNGKLLPILLHLEHAKTLQIYENLLLEEGGYKVKSNNFSTSMLIAEKMLSDYPLYMGYETQLRKEDREPLHVLFIGFGKRNQHLAFHILNLGHFLTKEKMHFTILDRDIERVEKEWNFLAKRSRDLANIQFKKVDLIYQGLLNELNQIDVPITHVYLSLKDDFIDMIEGIELMEKMPNVPIFLKMKDDNKISNWLDEHIDTYKQVKRYAMLGEVLNSDYVINEELKKLAKEAHNKYLKRKEDEGKRTQWDKDWEKLNAFKQESNRYQMLHNDTKLMLLGLKSVPKQDPRHQNEILDDAGFAEYIETYTESLAIVEHERWNAFHFLRGWKVTALDNPLPKHELENLKLHKGLTPWEELSEDFKEFDRDSIRYLKLFYNSQGKDLIKE